LQLLLCFVIITIIIIVKIINCYIYYLFYYLFYTDRTYRYFTGKPLYHFGYGLSYTTFKYSDGKVSSGNIKIGDSINVSISISNTGNIDGDEIVQVYIQYPDFPKEPRLSLKV
jgi:hypothetical protein